MSSFLFFLYHYPPFEGSANSRNKRIAEGIAAQVDKAVVLTVSPPSAPHVSPAVIQVPSRDYRWWLGQRKSGRPPSEKTKSSFFAQWIIKAINTYPMSILIGEGGWSYTQRLIRKGQRLIDKEGITHLYSSFRPFADHYAAYQLKRRNPNITWIADFRDLIIDPHYDQIFFEKSQQRLFKKIFSQANLLTTVSAGLAKHLEYYNPKVTVLRNGISNEAGQPLGSQQSVFSIVYTGSMFLDKRNPKPVFAALRQLIDEGKIDSNTIRITYAGKDGALWNELATHYKLEAILDNRGLIPQHQAMALQQNAGINLMLSIASENLQGVLTGKMIEYIEAGSPVMAISIGRKDDELDQILKEVEIGHAYSDMDNDLPVIKEFILTEYLTWQQTRFNRKPVNWQVVNAKFRMDQILTDFLTSMHIAANKKASSKTIMS